MIDLSANKALSSDLRLTDFQSTTQIECASANAQPYRRFCDIGMAGLPLQSPQRQAETRVNEEELQMLNEVTLTNTICYAIIGVIALLNGGVGFLQNNY